MLQPLQRKLEQRRDETIAQEQERHAQAVRNLLGWWQDTTWNPANQGRQQDRRDDDTAGDQDSAP